MDLADCYRILGLRTGATYEDIKVSYRRLARQYHPDANPSNELLAKEKFIQLTNAYRLLINAVPPSLKTDTPNIDLKQARERSTARAKPEARTPAQKAAKTSSKAAARTTPLQADPNLASIDRRLKERVYEQLQLLLREHRFPRAVTVIEGLAQRIPHDAEVRQWQAITYQRFGRHLISEQQPDKARIYLQKALRTDPHNKSLWYEVDRDLRRIDQIEVF